MLDGSGPANTAAIRVDIEPGTTHRYSGGGYTVMQQLIEDVRGQPFAQVMREYVLDPAGMTESTYEQPLPDSLWSRATTGHRPGGEPVEGNWHTYPEMAAAGLWTTPSDLLKYVDQIQRARAGEEGLILSRAMVDQVLTPGVGGHGLGPALIQEGALRFGHGGANEGFRGAFQGYADSGRGVAVLTNSDTGGALMEEVLLGRGRRLRLGRHRAARHRRGPAIRGGGRGTGGSLSGRESAARPRGRGVPGRRRSDAGRRRRAAGPSRSNRPG